MGAFGFGIERCGRGARWRMANTCRGSVRRKRREVGRSWEIGGSVTIGGLGRHRVKHGAGRKVVAHMERSTGKVDPCSREDPLAPAEEKPVAWCAPARRKSDCQDRRHLSNVRIMKHVSLLLCLACLVLASPSAEAAAAADELYVKVFNTILQADDLTRAGQESRPWRNTWQPRKTSRSSSRPTRLGSRSWWISV